ncbi:MAG: hotdog fold thioesterase [Spirochaetales bacterium]|nr:hotdog fold thioesterase [Spirochaetales bacterium]
MIDQFARADKFAEFTGIEFIEAGEGFARAKVKLEDKHLNSVGTVHGGLLFTLADYVFAIACNSYGTIAVAINASISYFRAVKEGVLTASAREVSIQRKLSHYLIEIKDEGNNLIALFQGMAYRKKETYMFNEETYG